MILLYSRYCSLHHDINKASYFMAYEVGVLTQVLIHCFRSDYDLCTEEMGILIEHQLLKWYH